MKILILNKFLVVGVEPRRYGGVECDGAAWLALEMVTATDRWRVSALSVVCLNPKLHSHNPSQGPQVSPALARLHERCTQCGGSTGEGLYLLIIIIIIIITYYSILNSTII